ncbi:TetR family transcriptional regulator [Rhodocyclus tenuis]|uniref:TetR family transcriptional regulator n=1 Tax=Rhodocyclus tenuis TaxID=1066 RepID=UPI0019033B26|nr:TetR family transcriptional regulator [Rhodocyclus tenuis]MBK1681725.1 TetR family transcriptional regulator [Rhodocyclus tenuis]
MVRKTKEEAGLTRQQIVDAARAVFHECGVSRTSLEAVARVAGVTRGAVYWHFKGKAELFLAVREEVFSPLLARSHAILDDERYTDPLDAIEASITDFFKVLDECPTLRQVFEIMMLRCEYVDEFAEVQSEALKPSTDLQVKIERAYLRAAECGSLRAGVEPFAVARDTWAFSSGLLHQLLDVGFENGLKAEVPAMVAAHMALRRRG